MIQANVSQVKSRLSYYLRLVQTGEKMVICDRNRSIAELVPIMRPIDRDLRRSAFGMFSGGLTEAELREALRPMMDDEAEAFLEGRD